MAENRAAAERAKTDAPGPDDAVEEGGAHPADREGPRKAARAADKVAAGTPPAAKASYLLTLARVKDLYRTRHYELGLVELVDLEKQYPDDEHILSMKGSLYERLGNKNLARESWQEALRLNPFNLAVLEALQRLGK
jgi:tetratricopeptide (TPR) repeat protein